MTSGVLTLVVGIVLALTVEPLLGLIAVAGIIDFALAWAYATGRLGDPGGQVAEELAPNDAARDPSYNPYAHED